MGSFISVASQYTIYEIEEGVAEVIGSGHLTQPPQIVLEVLVANGKAKRVGTVGTLNLENFTVMEDDDDDDDDEPEEGAGPWL